MEEYEKEALLYSFLDYSNDIGGTGPKEILQPIIQRGICALNKTVFTLEELGKEIESEFGRRIDLLVIRTELTRLQSNGDVQYNREQRKYTYLYPLKDYKEQYNNAKDSSDVFQRELKQYIDTITDHYTQLTIAKVFKYFCHFVESNVSEFIKIIINKESNMNMQHDNSISKFIEKFIFERVLEKIELYVSFERIFNGIIMYYVYENCSSLFHRENAFGEKHFFLDTNIVLRILGLQDTTQNILGKELKCYLQDENFKISITNDTWKEICSLINGYRYNYHRINAQGYVSHIYQVMKEDNIIPDGVEDFIEDIHSKLIEEGINIESTVQIQALDFKELDLLTLELAKKKYENQCDLLGEVFNPENNTPDLYIRQADHDLRNIYNIIYLRNNIRNTDFFKEKYYFITADYILKTFIKEKIRHTGQAYAIGDGTLAFLLYYKNPNNTKGFSVQSFINAHFESRKLSIKNWYIYYETVKEKYKSNQITKEQAGYLLCRVILDNEKFSVSGIENIIEDAIKDYKRQEEEYNIARNEAEASKKEKEEYKKLYDEMSKNIAENIALVTSLEEQVIDNKRKNIILENTLTTQSKEIKSNKLKTTIILILLIILSVALFLTNNKIFGSFTTLLSFVLLILDLIKRLRK